MALNTGNVGVVKHPVKASNNLRNEIGNMTGGSIDGSLSATTVVQSTVDASVISPQDHPSPGQPGVSHPPPATARKLRKSSASSSTANRRLALAIENEATQLSGVPVPRLPWQRTEEQAAQGWGQALGTGYNAALLSRLVGGTGRVTSVDIDPDLVADATAALSAVAGRRRYSVPWPKGRLVTWSDRVEGTVIGTGSDESHSDREHDENYGADGVQPARADGSQQCDGA